MQLMTDASAMLVKQQQ